MDDKLRNSRSSMNCRSNCKRKCSLVFSASDRHQVHHSFFGLSTQQERTDWLRRYIDETSKDGVHQQAGESIICDKTYSLPRIDNGKAVKLKVCGAFFKAVLNMSAADIARELNPYPSGNDSTSPVFEKTLQAEKGNKTQVESDVEMDFPKQFKEALPVKKGEQLMRDGKAVTDFVKEKDNKYSNFHQSACSSDKSVSTSHTSVALSSEVLASEDSDHAVGDDIDSEDDLEELNFGVAVELGKQIAALFIEQAIRQKPKLLQKSLFDKRVSLLHKSFNNIYPMHPMDLHQFLEVYTSVRDKNTMANGSVEPSIVGSLSLFPSQANTHVEHKAGKDVKPSHTHLKSSCVNKEPVVKPERTLEMFCGDENDVEDDFPDENDDVEEDNPHQEGFRDLNSHGSFTLLSDKNKEQTRFDEFSGHTTRHNVSKPGALVREGLVYGYNIPTCKIVVEKLRSVIQERMTCSETKEVEMDLSNIKQEICAEDEVAPKRVVGRRNRKRCTSSWGRPLHKKHKKAAKKGNSDSLESEASSFGGIDHVPRKNKGGRPKGVLNKKRDGEYRVREHRENARGFLPRRPKVLIVDENEAKLETYLQRGKGWKHPMLPTCQCNRRFCDTKFTEERRQEIHDMFWGLDTSDERKDWLQKYVDRLYKPKRIRSFFDNAERENCKKLYFFPDTEGNRVEVCRIFFHHTIGIKSESVVDWFIKSKQPQQCKPVETRQLQKSFKKLPQPVIDSIKEYISLVKDPNSDLFQEVVMSVESSQGVLSNATPTTVKMESVVESSDLPLDKQDDERGTHQSGELENVKTQQMNEVNVTNCAVKRGQSEFPPVPRGRSEFPPVPELSDDIVKSNKPSAKMRILWRDYMVRYRYLKFNLGYHSFRRLSQAALTPYYYGFNPFTTDDNESNIADTDTAAVANEGHEEQEENNCAARSLNLLDEKKERKNVSRFIDALLKRKRMIPEADVCQSQVQKPINDTHKQNGSVEESGRGLQPGSFDIPQTVSVEEGSQEHILDVECGNMRPVNATPAEIWNLPSAYIPEPSKTKPKPRLKTYKRNDRTKFPMRKTCKCARRRCWEKFTEEIRRDIYTAFWDLPSYRDRKLWMADHLKCCDIKRRRNDTSWPLKRAETRFYFLPLPSGEKVEVCKDIFMNTIGYNSDHIFHAVKKLSTEGDTEGPAFGKGNREPANKLKMETVASMARYIETVCTTHRDLYRRRIEGKYNKNGIIATMSPCMRNYGLTVLHLFKDYKTKHPSYTGAYHSFARVFKKVYKAVVLSDKPDEVMMNPHPTEPCQNLSGSSSWQSEDTNEVENIVKNLQENTLGINTEGQQNHQWLMHNQADLNAAQSTGNKSQFTPQLPGSLQWISSDSLNRNIPHTVPYPDHVAVVSDIVEGSQRSTQVMQSEINIQVGTLPGDQKQKQLNVKIDGGPGDMSSSFSSPHDLLNDLGRFTSASSSTLYHNAEKKRPSKDCKSTLSYAEAYTMLPPCKCVRYRCFSKFSDFGRQRIYDEFWSLPSHTARKKWLLDHMQHTRNAANSFCKTEAHKYFLTRDVGVVGLTDVCKKFFLHTLGFQWNSMPDTIKETMTVGEVVLKSDTHDHQIPKQKLSADVTHRVIQYCRTALQVVQATCALNSASSYGSPVDRRRRSADIPNGHTMQALLNDYLIKNPNHKLGISSFRRIYKKILLGQENQLLEAEATSACVGLTSFLSGQQ